MSNLGKWNRWYSGLQEPQPYGDTVTYKLGYEFLEDCEVIEDWGCGKGWFKQFCKPDQYWGIDGSHSVFADEIVDLTQPRTSKVEGIFMRHVIEHNYDWQCVLANALQCFTRKMALILFTPMSKETIEINYEPDPGVPSLSFSLSDLDTVFNQFSVWNTHETLNTATQYGEETIFYIRKESRDD